jgi:hypothetical protein
MATGDAAPAGPPPIVRTAPTVAAFVLALNIPYLG